MQVVRGLDFRPLFSRPTVVAAGNFDGLHLGHREILRRLAEQAGRQRLMSVVLTFSPHPERVLGRKKIAMIQTSAQRLEGLREFAIQAVVIAPFTRTFAGLSVGSFVDRILVGTLGAREIVVGENFRFGRGRRGDIQTLRLWGEKRGFGVHPVPAVVKSGRVVSSSLIRQLLAGGRVVEAADFLGRPYEITGRVVGGSARGRTLGFPTANVSPDNEILPAGVFVTTTVVDGREQRSVTNIGTRPTFGYGPVRVETFLLDYRGNLYRRRVRLRLLKRLRPERTFPTRESLVEQIRSDVREARRFFGLDED